MDIRTAILKAADHIQANPKAYDFQSNDYPSCDTPGCMIGWIGSFAGLIDNGRHCYAEQFRNAFGFDFHDIVAVWMKLPVGHELRCDTQANPKVAAGLMRLYADRYHPAAPVLYPDWLAMASKRTVTPDAVSQDARV